MQFITCKKCNTVIAIKNLEGVFSQELLAQATVENTVAGPDLCLSCAAELEAQRKAAEEAAKQAEQNAAGNEGDTYAEE